MSQYLAIAIGALVFGYFAWRTVKYWIESGFQAKEQNDTLNAESHADAIATEDELARRQARENATAADKKMGFKQW